MVEVGRLGQDTFDLVLSLHTVNIDGFRKKSRNTLRVQGRTRLSLASQPAVTAVTSVIKVNQDLIITRPCR